MNRRTVLKGGIIVAATAHTLALAPVIATTTEDTAPIPGPEERIEAAMAEIEAAMSEMYPGWEIQRESKAIRPIRYADKAELAPVRHGVLIFATSNEFGPERGRWIIDHA